MTEATLQLAALPSSIVPELIATAGEQVQARFWEFFAANIRNKHTRRAYYQASREFLAWCKRARVDWIADVKPLHVAAYIEQLARDGPHRLSNNASPRSGTSSIGL
jgi:site-specific recombinase XerD